MATEVHNLQELRRSASLATKVFIQRDYSDGTICQFQTKFPPELDSRIERQLFEETVKTLNSFYAEAEKIGGSSYLEGCLACATAYFIFLCMETHYEKVLKKISRYIQEQNEKIFAPRGLLLTDPVERGMRVIEISIYEDRCSSGSSSSGSSSGSGSSAPPALLPLTPGRTAQFRTWHFPQGAGLVTAARSSRARLGRGGQHDLESPFLLLLLSQHPAVGLRSQREFPSRMIPQPKSHIHQDSRPPGSCSRCLLFLGPLQRLCLSVNLPPPDSRSGEMGATQSPPDPF